MWICDIQIDADAQNGEPSQGINGKLPYVKTGKLGNAKIDAVKCVVFSKAFKRFIDPKERYKSILGGRNPVKEYGSNKLIKNNIKNKINWCMFCIFLYINIYIFYCRTILNQSILTLSICSDQYTTSLPRCQKKKSNIRKRKKNYPTMAVP